MSEHILSIIWLTPLVGMIAVMCLPKESKDLIRYVANGFAVLGVLVTIPMIQAFDSSNGDFQLVERFEWIPALGAQYYLGVDGFGYLMVLLTVVVGWLSILCSWSSIQDRVKEYYAFFLFLQAGMLGVFMVLDIFLFYVFWEIMLVPMYFIIGIWGGGRRLYAAIKFFLYTLAGSVLMLLAMLTVYFQHAEQFGHYSFAIEDLMRVAAYTGPEMQFWLFWGFFIAFAVKVPMFPFHTWLPDAHTEAPTAGSVILAGILLKMGLYGLVRFAMPMFPKGATDDLTVQLVAFLSIIGIVYGALVSLMQKDWKRLVAYSSVSHLGFCTLGLIALNPNGIAGGMLQGFNHGLSTPLLFLAVGIVYDQRHTREIADYGGLANRMPIYTVLFAISLFASMGMPGLNGFIGEFTILRGAFEVSIWWAGFAVLGIVLGAAYLLWLFQRVMLGPVTNPKNEGLRDMNLREIVVMAPLIAGCFWVGLYPKPFFEILKAPTDRLVERLDPDYFSRTAPTDAESLSKLLAADVPKSE